MSSNNKFQKELEKRLLNLEKIVKELSEHVKLLKPLLVDVSSPKNSAISIEVTRKPEEPTLPNCLHYFGYLRYLPKTDSIPGECFLCQNDASTT